MAELFAAYIQNMNITEELLSRVSERRREFIGRVKSRNAAKLCLAAGLLINEVIGGRELTDASGKPYVRGGRSFSVSHSGEVAVLAASDSSVGVDIQEMSDKDFMKLANRAFHEDEMKRLLCSNDKRREFFSIWTMKESLVKAWGTGFTMDPRTVNVFDRTDFNFFVRGDIGGYALSVCTADKNLKDIIILEF